MSDTEDLYKILQVHQAAAPEVIEAAYKRLMRMYHPDVNEAAEAHEMSVKLNSAHDILGDQERREEYDRDRAQQVRAEYGSGDGEPKQEGEQPKTERVYGLFAEESRRSQSGRDTQYQIVRLTRALFSSIASQNASRVGQLLDAGADVNTRSSGGWTPLHVATSMSSPDIVAKLIAAGSCVEASVGNGLKPLHFASMNGHSDVIDLLIASGVEVDPIDGSFSTPLHLASAPPGTSTGVRALIGAGRRPQCKEKRWLDTPDHCRGSRLCRCRRGTCQVGRPSQCCQGRWLLGSAPCGE